MKKNRKNNPKEASTPIMDGDARPDKLIEPDPHKMKTRTEDQGKRNVTENREGDVNTLEDYKDAK